MRTATMPANDIKLGTPIILHEDTLWGSKIVAAAVTGLKCSLRDHDVEIEVRDHGVLRALVRHSPDWPMAVAA